MTFSSAVTAQALWSASGQRGGASGKVGRGGGEDAWWRRCGRSGGRQLSAPRAATEPRGLGPPPSGPRRSALSARFPLLSHLGCLAAGPHLGRPRASVREDVGALLGEVQGPCPSWGPWPAHCLRLSSRAGGWAPVGGSGCSHGGAAGGPGPRSPSYLLIIFLS